MGRLIDMEYEELLQFKKTLKEQQRLVEGKLLAVQEALNGMYEANCFICEHVTWAFNDLPKGWGYLVDDHYPVLVCDKCIAKWEDRWVICKTTRGNL
jgi:hypothetical protein